MSVRRKRLDRDDGQADGAEPIRRDYRASQPKSAGTLEYRLARLDGAPVVVKKPTRLSHDFRRTAARRLIRAGVPEVTAMTLLGHATNSIFKRTRSSVRG